MAINHLLRQTITLSTAGHQDKYGKKTFSAPVTMRARFQPSTRSIAGPQNERIPIDGIVFVKTGTAVVIGDKVHYDGLDYKVMSVDKAIGGRGQVHHLELMVQRWAL